MKNTYRNMSVVLEIKRTIKMLTRGLAEIQRITPENDFYDPVFMFLSSGIERLFKTMLCLQFKDYHGRLPKQNEIWDNRNGHNLIALKKKIEQMCIPVNRPFAKNDYNIITSDIFINSICKVLSEYGKQSRYFDIDAIHGIRQSFNSNDEWEKLETQIGKEKYGEKEFYELLEQNQLDRIYDDSNKAIIIKLEMFFRALTRQFIFGNFSKSSKSFLFEIESFSDIEDKQLGKIDYNHI